MTVKRAKHPASLSLLGLARISDTKEKGSPVLDFGQSYIKRGIAYYKNNKITSGLDNAIEHL